MYTITLILHVIVCVGLVAVVLLQAGKGGGFSGMFGGGGSSDQLFNAPSGMAFIKKVTVAMAVMFMITSMGLTVMTSQMSRRSVIQQLPDIPAVPTAPVK